MDTSEENVSKFTNNPQVKENKSQFKANEWRLYGSNTKILIFSKQMKNVNLISVLNSNKTFIEISPCVSDLFGNILIAFWVFITRHLMAKWTSKWIIDGDVQAKKILIIIVVKLFTRVLDFYIIFAFNIAFPCTFTMCDINYRIVQFHTAMRVFVIIQ